MSSQGHSLPGAILIVEDEKDLADLIAAALREQGLGTARAATGAAALTWLAGHTPALVLLDYVLPDMTGLQFLEQAGKPLPFMVMTAAVDESAAVGLMKLGARDYLIKDASFLDRLPPAVQRVLNQLEVERRRADAEELARQEQALLNATIDSIPGAFYMLDENGRYVRWNAYQRDEIVGKPEDLVAGTNALDTIHPDDRELVRARIANVLVNGAVETVEGRVLLRGGPAFRWLLMTGRQMVFDGRPFLVGIGVDITERKRAEGEQARQVEELRRWHTVTLGREGRIAELKREVNALAVRLGEKPRYGSVDGH